MIGDVVDFVPIFSLKDTSEVVVEDVIACYTVGESESKQRREWLTYVLTADRQNR